MIYTWRRTYDTSDVEGLPGETDRGGHEVIGLVRATHAANAAGLTPVDPPVWHATWRVLRDRAQIAWLLGIDIAEPEPDFRPDDWEPPRVPDEAAELVVEVEVDPPADVEDEKPPPFTELGLETLALVDASPYVCGHPLRRHAFLPAEAVRLSEGAIGEAACTSCRRTVTRAELLSNARDESDGVDWWELPPCADCDGTRRVSSWDGDDLKPRSCADGRERP